MADGMIGNAAKAVMEAVVKPTVDEVGKMVEDGVSTATGKQKQDPTQKADSPDPSQIAQDDAAKKRKALANIAQFTNQMTQNAAILKQQNEQREAMKKQQEEQKKAEVRQFEFSKKQESDMRAAELQRAKTRAENKNAGAG